MIADTLLITALYPIWYNMPDYLPHYTRLGIMSMNPRFLYMILWICIDREHMLYLKRRKSKVEIHEKAHLPLL